jgi:hypothetical protein
MHADSDWDILALAIPPTAVFIGSGLAAAPRPGMTIEMAVP